MNASPLPPHTLVHTHMCASAIVECAHADWHGGVLGLHFPRRGRSGTPPQAVGAGIQAQAPKVGWRRPVAPVVLGLLACRGPLHAASKGQLLGAVMLVRLGRQTRFHSCLLPSATSSGRRSKIQLRTQGVAPFQQSYKTPVSRVNSCVCTCTSTASKAQGLYCGRSLSFPKVKRAIA